MSGGKNIDWGSAKADYFAKNLKQDKQKPFTLKDLSLKWCVSYKTIRNKASQENWAGQLQAKVKEQNTQIVAEVQSQGAFNEAEIRLRQAEIARKAVSKALVKLENVKPNELTNKEAIDLLKLGLIEERKALGLPEKFEFRSQDLPTGQLFTVEDRIKQHKQVEVIALSLLQYVEKHESSK